MSIPTENDFNNLVKEAQTLNTTYDPNKNNYFPGGGMSYGWPYTTLYVPPSVFVIYYAEKTLPSRTREANKKHAEEFASKLEKIGALVWVIPGDRFGVCKIS